MHFLRNSLVSSALFVLSACAAFGQSFTSNQPVDVEIPAKVRSSVMIAVASPFQKLNVTVSLPYADPVGVQAFADSVSDPSSPNYRKFITPEEVGERFGVSAGQQNEIAAYLASRGFKISIVSKNRLSVMGEATVAQAEAAFGTQINRYWHQNANGTGEEFFSFSTALNVPAGIAPFIRNVSGLDNASKPQMRALTATQARSLYSLTNSFTGGAKGLGRHVAISNFDGFDLANIPLYYTQMSLPSPAGGVGSNVAVVTIGGGSQHGTANAEGDLDIQMVLGMSPLCTFTIYDGGPTDLLGVLTREVNDNTADVISESYGWSLGTSSSNAAHDLHVSMTAQGITYMAASGDSGTTIEPFSYPNYEPEVLMVGGTTATVNGSGTRTTEVGWSGSGGGWSTKVFPFNVLPSWQKGKGVPTTINFRLSPDVSLHASGVSSGAYQFFLAGALKSGYIGTSFACPVFAGGLATAEQNIIANGGMPADSKGNRRLGRVQNLIYGQNGRSDVWFDITSGSSGTLPDSTTAVAGPNWDFVTGWGVINFDAFVSAQLAIVAVNSVTVSPTTTTGGLNATGTVTLAASAQANAAINLTSNNPKVTVPTTVTVLKGATTATFTVTTMPVTSTTIGTITAAVGTSSKTCTITLGPPKVKLLTFSPTTLAGGNPTSGTVTLTAGAPTGGLVVTLSDNSSAATTPASITVLAGATTGVFTVPTLGVTIDTTVTVTATGGGATANATFTLIAPSLQSITFSPTSVPGGKTAIGTVTLNGAAPSAGVVASLASVKPNIKVPASVTIPSGKTSATFTATTTSVATDVQGIVSAAANAKSVQTTLTVQAPRVSKVTVNPTSVLGGTNSIGTVTLTTNAPTGGVVVKLSKTNSTANVSTTVKVNAGVSTATFPITTVAVANDTNVDVTAALNGGSASATLGVTAPKVTAFKVSATTIKGGKPVTGTVTLSSNAPTGGLSVTISASDTSVTAVNIVVPAGSKTGSGTINTKPVGDDVSVTITATKGTSSMKATLKVLAPIAKFTVAPTTIKAGAAATGTLSLDGAAPAGFIWTITATGPVTLPGSVTFVSGSTSATFKITGTTISKSTPAKVNAARKLAKFTVSMTVNP